MHLNFNISAICMDQSNPDNVIIRKFGGYAKLREILQHTHFVQKKKL